MGMAASQSKLLTLTGRQHDIEYKAQSIMNEKLALATQKDALYNNYCEALDATKIQVAFSSADGTAKFVDATYETLVTYNNNRPMQYALKDAQSGKVLLNSDIGKVYDKFDRDKYSFAFAMIGMEGQFGYDDGDMGTGIGIDVEYDYEHNDGGSGSNLFMTDVERDVFNKYVESNGTLKKAYEDLNKICSKTDATKSEKSQALDKFRDELYKSYGSEIYKHMRLSKDSENGTVRDPDASGAVFDERFDANFPKDEFNFYVNLHESIKASGGYQVIGAQYESGQDGAEWLNKMTSSGRVIIDVFDSKKGWTETSIATSSNENYLQKTQDTKDLKKAELKYEHDLDVVNRKDTKYDQDLKNLETERSAIKTEMESVKKVKDDNVERTFGIFG